MSRRVAAHRWAEGDRVFLNPTGYVGDETNGTVTEVTEQGVSVHMDRPIRGETICVASPTELVPGGPWVTRDE
jgi:hypothetical protein